jgi:hypothetical protein
MRAHAGSCGRPPEEAVARKLWLQGVFPYSALWLAMVYVVAEGWKELDLHDEDVDALLDSPNLDLLRRFRNGAFHFQAKYYDDRFMGLLDPSGDPAKWVTNLYDAFDRWFIESALSWGVDPQELQERATEMVKRSESPLELWKRKPGADDE